MGPVRRTQTLFISFLYSFPEEKRDSIHESSSNADVHGQKCGVREETLTPPRSDMYTVCPRKESDNETAPNGLHFK